MSETDPRVEAFFAKAQVWHDELAALRAILLACPVVEEFKWSSPCYTAAGGNIATIWGLKESCVLAFYKGVLLNDTEWILVAPGENSRSVRMIRLTSLAQIAQMKPVLTSYILQAIAAQQAGLKVTFPKDDLVWPEELIAALEQNPDLQFAFEALTPGRQRGYILYFSGAEQSKTKTARIEKHTPRILAGKGMHDR